MRKRLKHRPAIGLESFERRLLLSGTAQFLSAANPVSDSAQVQPAAVLRPTYELLTSNGLTPLQTAGPQGYTPAEIRAAYGLNQVSFGGTAGSGAGQTIAIIDAYNDPVIASDLHAFDVAFGLTAPTLRVVAQDGSANLPSVDPVGPGGSNFEGEEALDVEWAHALAPGASIMLVEAKDASPSNLFAAANFAREQPGVSVISMSFGGNETGSETQFDSIFTTPAGHNGVTFIASTGDSGTPAGFPAYSPNVVAAGGTSLALDSLGNYQSEVAWSGSGGGISQVEAQPSYQSGVVTQSHSLRTTPDVAFDADPRTGVAVYDSYNNGAGTPWEILGGTSVAAPCWAGIIAVADQGRALAGKATLDSRTGALPLLYAAPAADFHDITSGSNGYPAGAGYDLVTGRGSPRANLLIPFLVTGTVAPPPPSNGPTIASISASATSLTEGQPLTLTANGVSDPGGTGLAVTFYEETNSVAGLQTGSGGDFAFTAVTDGSNALTLDTTNSTGTFTFYAQLTDSSGAASPAGTSAPTVAVTITAPNSSGPSIASISATPNPDVSGQTVTLTPNGLSDPISSIRRVYYYEETNGVPGLQTGPGGDFAFRPASAATSFTLQLDTTGVTGAFTFYAEAVDLLGDVSAAGSAAPATTLNVLSDAVPDAPTGLMATVVSGSEVDISFSETSSGQTGFTIERSVDPSFSSFTRVFSINRPDAITYSDTGLTAHTRYYYRVQAFNQAGASGFSNVAAATTASIPGGYIDIAGPTSVVGWAIDADTPATSLTVQLYVDGSLHATTTADISRPGLVPIYGSADHGYSFGLGGLTLGLHRIDVVALATVGSGVGEIGGSRTIDTNRPPTGWIDMFAPERLVGWALDPDAGSASIQIRYSIDDNAPVLATAAVSRPGLTDLFGSPDHGFDITLSRMTAGTHTVTVYGVDSTTQALTLLGTRAMTVTAAGGNPLPVGFVDDASMTRVMGWAADLSAPGSSIYVRVDVDGVAGVPFVAQIARPEVAAYLGVPGAYGFDKALSLAAGEHRIDVYALDAPTNAWILLASRMVASPAPAPLSSPAGFLDIATSTQIAGWAWSAALAGASATVRIDIDNLASSTFVASVSRPGVSAIYGPGNFGFSIPAPDLAPGTHNVVLFLIDPETLTPFMLAERSLVTA